MKFPNDSKLFMPEKLKNHIILTKNLIFNKKSEKLPKNSEKYPEILGFLPCGPVALWPYCIDVQILCKKKSLFALTFQTICLSITNSNMCTIKLIDKQIF